MRFFKFIICLCIILNLVLGFTSCICFAEETIYVWSSNSNSLSNNTTLNIKENQTTETNTEVSENNSLNLESASAILIEQTTGKILYSHNIHEQLRPASVTKVMSILLIMGALDTGKIALTDTREFDTFESIKSLKAL